MPKFSVPDAVRLKSWLRARSIFSLISRCPVLPARLVAPLDQKVKTPPSPAVTALLRLADFCGAPRRALAKTGALRQRRLPVSSTGRGRRRCPGPKRGSRVCQRPEKTIVLGPWKLSGHPMANVFFLIGLCPLLRLLYAPAVRRQRRRPRPVDEAGSRRWRSAPVFASALCGAPQKSAKRKRTEPWTQNGWTFKKPEELPLSPTVKIR